MKDKEFLQWIHDRLKNIHGESEFMDYMWKLRAIINDTPEDKFTVNVSQEYEKLYN